MRELLMELGVDAGMMSFSPTNLPVGKHTLTGICGDGIVIEMEGEDVDIHTRVAEVDDWGPRAHSVHIGGKHLPAGYTLAGRVSNPTGRIMLADPCYLYCSNGEEDVLPGEAHKHFKFWGRDAKQLSKALTEAGVRVVDDDGTYRVGYEYAKVFNQTYAQKCQDPLIRWHFAVQDDLLKAVPEDRGWLVMRTEVSSNSVYDNICDIADKARGGEYACRLGKGVAVSSGYGDGCYPLVQHDGFMKLTFIGPEGEHPYDLLPE